MSFKLTPFLSTDQPIIFPIMIRVGKHSIYICPTANDLPESFYVLEVSAEDT